MSETASSAMTWQQGGSSSNRASVLTSTPTTIPPIVFNQQIPINSLAKTTVASSTDPTVSASCMPRQSQRNCKQYSRYSKRPPNTICPVCGKAFYRPEAWKRKATTSVCSRQCNGKLRAKTLLEHNAKNPPKWTEERKQKARETMIGEKNPAWKDGVTYRRKHGNYPSVKYVPCPKEFLPMARQDGWVAEARLIVAHAIGRPLLQTETVHHINHNPLDNRVENLMLFRTNQEHRLFEAHGEPQPLWHGYHLSTIRGGCGASPCRQAQSSPDATARCSSQATAASQSPWM